MPPIEFIEKTINAQSPDNLNNPETFELLKTYQVNAHSKTCCKQNKNECQLFSGRYFIEMAIIAKPLPLKFSDDEKQKLLTQRNTLLRKVKSYFDNSFNPSKVDIKDQTKVNFTQPLSVKKFQIS